MWSRWLRTLGPAAAAAALVGWPLAPPPATAETVPAPRAVTVSMESFAFSPAAVHVTAGGTVTWTYDEKPTDVGCESPVFQTPLPVNCPGHSTTAVDHAANGKPLWDSGVHRADGFPYSHVFSTPGTYHYYCIVHGGAHPNNPVTHMDGEIIVDAAAPPLVASATAAGAAAKPSATPAVQGLVLARSGGRSRAGAGFAVLAVVLCGRAVRRRTRVAG